MQLAARLTREDALDLVRKFVPLEIDLGGTGKPERFVAIEDVSDVTLVANTGVRLACSAHARWPVLGIHVPLRARSLTLLFRPEIAIRDGHPSLVFGFTVEHADIAWSPALMNDSITERVNRELGAHHVEFAWNFAKTLSHVFRLPEAVKTAATFGTEVIEGHVTVTDSSIEMVVVIGAAVGPRGAG